MKFQFLSRFLRLGQTNPNENHGRRRIRFPDIYWSTLIALLLVSALIRVHRISDAVGGFHAVREAENLLLAEEFRGGTLLNPSADGVNTHLQLPPMYPYLIHVFMDLASSPIVMGRGISVLSSLGSIFLVFLLGKLLFSLRAGLIAALLFASTPMNVLVGHNAQSESLFLFLLLFTHLLYMQVSLQDKQKELRGVGLTFGVACLTNLVAWVSFPAWVLSETWRHRGFGWLKNRKIWMAAALTLMIFLPFYAYHWVKDSKHLINEVFNGQTLATASSPNISFTVLLKEAWWGFSPVVFLLFMVGLVWGMTRTDWRHRFLLLQASAFFLYCLLANTPSYSLLILSPFLALLAAEAIANVRMHLLVPLMTGVAVITGTVLSLVLLGQMKYGWDEMAQIRKFYNVECKNCMILVDIETIRQYAWVLHYSFGAKHIIDVGQLKVGLENEVTIDSLHDRLAIFVLTPDTKSGVDLEVNRTVYAPVLLGMEFREEHPNPHLFGIGRPLFGMSSPWSLFEIKPVERKRTLGLLYLQRELRIFRDGSNLIFKP